MNTPPSNDPLLADLAWFAEHQDNTFRYHIVNAQTAARLVNGPLGSPLDPTDAQDRFVLAWRANRTGEIAHAWVDMPLDEARTRIEMAAEHDADAFGVWLMLADLPILPTRPKPTEVPLSASVRSFLAGLMPR